LWGLFCCEEIYSCAMGEVVATLGQNTLVNETLP